MTTYRLPWPEHKPGDLTVIRVSSADGKAYARVLTDGDPLPLPSPPGNGWTLLVEDDDDLV